MTATSDHTGSRWWWLLLPVLACGCGSRFAFAPVEGSLTQKGKPLAGVQVIFFTDGATRGPRASGVTDDQGHYRLRVDDRQEGAPIGKHRVCLLEPPPLSSGGGTFGNIAAPPTGEKPTTPPRIPSNYGSPATTPLRAEVRPGVQTIDFQVQ
jgi:hypothetical protein